MDKTMTKITNICLIFYQQLQLNDRAIIENRNKNATTVANDS